MVEGWLSPMSSPGLYIILKKLTGPTFTPCMEYTPFMSRVFDQIAVGDHHMNTTTEHKLHWSNYQHDNIIDKLEGYHYMPINISIASKIMAPHSELAQLGKPSPNNIAHF